MTIRTHWSAKLAVKLTPPSPFLNSNPSKQEKEIQVGQGRGTYAPTAPLLVC